MAIKRVKTGWQVNIQPGGRGAKRLKKTFAQKAEALAWERYIRVKVQETPDWVPAKKDVRRLTDLVELWFKQHGSNLRAGLDTYKRLLAMCHAMGNPCANAFTVNLFAEYRAARLSTGITANNMNREQAYLRAVFNELIRLDHWQKENPLKTLRAIKVQENELSYLTSEQIIGLYSELRRGKNKHVALITKICLATGARWGEAETIRITQIKQGTIQFVQTKSSKSRAVPITTQLEHELKLHYSEYGWGERLFTAAWSAFREAIERAGIQLPRGQMTHVLRHTFASHFMMNGGNILALQKALGHHSLAMTMRYAHLSPEHLQETRRLNPLAKLNLG